MTSHLLYDAISLLLTLLYITAFPHRGLRVISCTAPAFAALLSICWCPSCRLRLLYSLSCQTGGLTIYSTVLRYSQEFVFKTLNRSCGCKQAPNHHPSTFMLDSWLEVFVLICCVCYLSGQHSGFVVYTVASQLKGSQLEAAVLTCCNFTVSVSVFGCLSSWGLTMDWTPA